MVDRYVVTTPQAPRPAPYWYLVEDGKMLDIDPLDMDRWCEYILWRGLQSVLEVWLGNLCADLILSRIGYARISRGSNPQITDTELQVGRFLVPQEPIAPDVDSSLGQRISSDRVLPTRRFSDKFYGHGVRGLFGQPSVKTRLTGI